MCAFVSADGVTRLPSYDSIDCAAVVTSSRQSTLHLHNNRCAAVSTAINGLIIIVVAVWVIVRIWVKERPREWKREVIEDNNLVETMEAMKSIVEIVVTVVETAEATKSMVPIQAGIIEMVESGPTICHHRRVRST